MYSVQRLLVVEDDRALAAGVQATLATTAREVRHARSAAEARETLLSFRPDLMILDVLLAEGTAFDVLALAAGLDTVPTVIGVSGSVSSDDSFRLAQLGVRAFLAKPFTADDLRATVDQALTTPPDLNPLLRACVGQRPVREVEDQVRRTMVAEALGRSRGSRRRAAGLLAISRQLLQHILRSQA